jgi:hypothetical protein
LTGSTTSILNHPINVIKMHNWNNDTSTGILKLSKELRNKFGIGIFGYGLQYTLLRDSMFTCVFFGLSKKYNKERSIIKDLFFGTLATIASAPSNYYRTRLFFNFDKKINFVQITSELAHDVMSNGNTFFKRFLYLMHGRLNIGFGTMRVGLGIATSKKIYDLINEQTNKLK